MTILSTFADSLPDLITLITHIDHHIRMQKCDSNCTSQKNWFDLAGTSSDLSEQEPLNAFECFQGVMNTNIDDHCLPADFGEQPEIPYPSNI